MTGFIEEGSPIGSIPYRYNWNIMDATKLNNYLDCPRKFFYERVWGLTPEHRSFHLHFGTCWHLAKERLRRWMATDDFPRKAFNFSRLLSTMISKEFDLDMAALQVIRSLDNPITEAFNLFETEYRSLEDFQPDSDEHHHPKNPGRAALALLLYADNMYLDSRSLLFCVDGTPMTEISGAISLGEFLMHYRMDAICINQIGEVVGIEEKTGSPSSTWGAQWDLDPQPQLYNMVLYATFESDKISLLAFDQLPKITRVAGLDIEGTLFEKKTKLNPKFDVDNPGRHITFANIPIRRNKEMMQTFYSNLCVRLKEIQENYSMLRVEAESPKRIGMASFQCRPRQCHSFYGRECIYKLFCQHWTNPITHWQDGEIPPGFTIEHWDPRERNTNLTLNVEI